MESSRRTIESCAHRSSMLGVSVQHSEGMSRDLTGILAGSDDELLLQELYLRINLPCNPAQALFVDAWELTTFIASDGFEILFEQDRTLDDFGQVLADIGFREALPIFQKVEAVVPDALLANGYNDALRDHLSDNFDLLKELLYEYLDLANGRLLLAFGEFVRGHKGEFEIALSGE